VKTGCINIDQMVIIFKNLLIGGLARALLIMKKYRVPHHLYAIQMGRRWV